MSGNKRTEDLQSLKTRQLTYQYTNGYFPDPYSLLAAADDRGHFLPTLDISVNSVTTTSLTINESENAYPPIGSIMQYAGSISPNGWMLCNGATYSIYMYNALYNVIGYTYGGTGDSFAIPDLRARVPVGLPGTPYSGSIINNLGAIGGEEKHTLTVDELASHAHNWSYTQNAANSGAISGTTGYWGGGDSSGVPAVGSGITDSSGNNVPHNNIQPYIVLNYIIKY